MGEGWGERAVEYEPRKMTKLLKYDPEKSNWPVGVDIYQQFFCQSTEVC